MDVFRVRDQLIEDYRDFTGSFVEIHDKRIAAHVAERMDNGYQWPDPWLSLNPNFASGGTVTELIEAGLLQPECERIFRLKDTGNPDGPVLRLHLHQREAIEAGRTGDSYVLTTGTGSGKSLSYIVPIVDRVLAAKAAGTYRRGIKAIVVYPMNALANSQLGELGKFLQAGYPEGHPPVTFARYTGQESADRRAEIIADPPDILLTNYVMLELVLTRPRERDLIASARGLWFLVLDELHTYRGRQGADVALLVRRLRETCEAPDIQCVGTSATMTSSEEGNGGKQAVADVATTLFGVPVKAERVIGETLERATDPAAVAPEALAARIAAPSPPEDYSAFLADPLAAWIEETLGFDPDTATDRPRRRRRPLTLPKAAAELAEQTGAEPLDAADAIRLTLQAGSRIVSPATNRPLFAFRLHQFLSKGDNVYVTIEQPPTRHVTSTYQVAAPARDDGPDRILVPLAFCRECGQDYLVVTRTDDQGTWRYAARQDNDASGGDSAGGYLFVSDDQAWPASLEQVVTDSRLPYSWLSDDPVTGLGIDPGRRALLPQPVWVDATGREVAHDQGGTYAAYVPSPFRFCLRCRTSYEQARGSDFAKLAQLSAEGRSSAMTLITESVVRALRSLDGDDDERARKLLAFVDNRQDASLQAGHFNDFVQVTQLRGALHRALEQAPDGLTDEIVAQRVTQELSLDMADFAQQPGAKYSQKDEAWRALREVTGYRLYLDLERGWRVTMPNLEQTGLLRIRYRDLKEIAADADAWDGCHFALREDDAEHRQEIAETLLDELRRNLAIEVGYLTEDGFDQVKRLSAQHLKEPWSLPEREQPPAAAVAFPGPSKPGLRHSNVFVSRRSGFGQYLIREYAARKIALKSADADEIIKDLFVVLSESGLLTEAVRPDADGEVAGYRLRAAAIQWLPGTGLSGAEDRVRRTVASEEGPRVNPFFRDLYKAVAEQLSGLRAKEHTAQVPPAERQQREDEFSKATLPVLYCSPTMELGVDISALSAVGLRNVPPTPANYAQRAGRAGRSGQPALVVTYCATGNAHDQYYFRRPEDMVGGSVAAPRLDLANEDLVRSHVHAIWLAETGLDLGGSLTDILDASGDKPSYELLPQVRQLVNSASAAQRASRHATRVLAGVAAILERSPWWRAGWIEDAVRGAPAAFDAACERWRELYKLALTEFQVQSARSVDSSLKHSDRNIAAGRARDARVQLNLLANEGSDDFQTDFYAYRYFASEGFLPGYSFPRLPLAAYIPGLAGRREGDYIQRPRFIGIGEFGPGAVIYHEGARYQVVSAALPPVEPGQAGLVTTSVRRCGECGYLNDDAVGIDVCDSCAEPLRDTMRDMLRLTSVRTRRRDRISSDEEERRRSGFELQTSYRFGGYGGHASRIEATATAYSGPLLSLQYGDAATVRVTNVGRRRRQNPNQFGYPIDVTTGRWLKQNERADQAVPEEEDLEASAGVKRKQRVIPYVEDRRNILVTRLATPVSEDTAVTAAVALERGIEAAFQLEDSELSCELLPDSGGRGRALFIESAEGGAGVLRRVVEESGALQLAAQTALRIMHFDPDTGADRAEQEASRGAEPCVRACYDCLLSYGNQGAHKQIDRHLVRDLVLSLSRGTTLTAAEKGPSPEPAGEGAARFVTWLADRDLRLPDETDVLIEGTRPDLVYRLGDGNVAVFVGAAEQHSARDKAAQEVLRDLGWSVITVGDESSWTALTERYPSVFGAS
jgi:superfamily II DNA/RNA helicase